MIDEIMEYNRKFVENKGYEPYLTSKYPDKKLAILTCMDTRLLELLPAALGIKNGDAKIIKNAGGVIVHPYGSVVRSLLVGILELGVEEVMSLDIPTAACRVWMEVRCLTCWWSAVLTSSTLILCATAVLI